MGGPHLKDVALSVHRGTALETFFFAMGLTDAALGLKTYSR